MGKDAITMDFNGVVTKEQLKEIEVRANEAVVANLDVLVQYPTKEELKDIYYRSKIEIEGQVRLVTVPGHDACACCAPHVKKTGEIGVIKLIGLQNYKGGVRISMLCGFRALQAYEAKSEWMKELSISLSAPEQEVVCEVTRLKEELATCKTELAKLNQTLLEYKVKEIESGQDLVILFEEKMDGNAPRELVNLLLARDTKIGAVFAGNEEEGYRYVIGSQSVDVRPLSGMLREKFAARGGGKPEMVQGSVNGLEVDIREAIETCKNELR
jgi:alanyl-tRNA synthetase